MNKASKKYGIMWKDQIYIWLVSLKVMGRMRLRWKTLFGVLSRRTSPTSKAGQHSNPGNTENTTEVFLEKSNPKTCNCQIHQGWNEGKNTKGSQREKSAYPQREAHQTDSGSLGRNPTSQKKVEPIFNILKEKNFQPRILYLAKQLHKQRRNKILCRQATAERCCHHQASLTRAPEGSPKHGKE